MNFMVFSHMFVVSVCDLNLENSRINFGQILNSIENMKTPVDLKYRPYDANMIMMNNLFPYVRVSPFYMVNTYSKHLNHLFNWSDSDVGDIVGVKP